jgi:hypothetical protein
MFKIEKGIPLWEKQQTPVEKRKYPFHEMEVGDSFLLENITREDAGRVHTYAERYHVKVKTRRVTDTSWRVWLIEKL